jgi:hypothetical protein
MAIGLFMVMSPAALAETISTVDGSGADAYVYYFSNGTNYGSDTYFRLSKNYVGYLKFDLSGQGPNTIVDANLTLYGTPIPASSPGYDYAVPVYGLLDGSDEWGELTITYSNAPLAKNPILRHPLLINLGWLDYTDGDETAITMRHAGGTPLNSFLNNRGPDGTVTMILGSDKYTVGNFFSTKEDHGDGSESPFITFEVDPNIVQLNDWVGADSNDWSEPNNWLNESSNPEVPDGSAVVNLVGGSNYPVIIDANASAKKLFINTGGLNLVSGMLTLTGGVLRIKDGVTMDIIDGEVRLAGNVEGHMWGLIGTGKIITTKGSVWETSAEYDSGTNQTIVKARKLVRKLVWGNSLVDANGPLAPDQGGQPAEYCVDGRDMLGETHMGFTDKGAPIISNSYYGRNLETLGFNYEPILKFEFDDVYALTDMYIWNYTLAYAFKTVEIEYSVDDVNYTLLMNDSEPNFILNYGNKDGTKNDIISFGGAPAKYVKLTAIGGPYVGNYGGDWYGRYIMREIQFCHEGMEASNPAPLNGKEVDIFLQLEWLPGNGAVTGQDIYLYKTGDTPAKIAANIGPEVDRYQVGPLENLADYTWRVDGLDGASTTSGPEWAFSTRARLRWNPGIIGVVNAEGSSGVNGTPGDRAVNESGLTYDLHDSFEWSNGWYCRKPWDLIPPIHEPNLIITFDRIYDINEMWVWNHDGTSAAEAEMALKTIKIEYSTNGTSYTTLMNGAEPNFVLPHGNTDGTHDTEIGFGNVPVKYVRITAVGGPGVGNYGSTDWGYKLREVRFYYQVPLWADLNYTKTVDFLDYAVVAEDWLVDNWTTEPVPHCPGKPDGDINGDCRVYFEDIAVIVDEWLDDIN